MTDLKILAETCRNVASLCTGTDQMQRRDHMLEIAEFLEGPTVFIPQLQVIGKPVRLTERDSDIPGPPPFEYQFDKRNRCE